MFQKYGSSSRATTAGVLDNVRMVMESAMVDGLVGSSQVLRTLPQKRAFLLALHPKDRLRLLHMVETPPPPFHPCMFTFTPSVPLTIKEAPWGPPGTAAQDRRSLPPPQFHPSPSYVPTPNPLLPPNTRLSVRHHRLTSMYNESERHYSHLCSVSPLDQVSFARDSS